MDLTLSLAESPSRFRFPFPALWVGLLTAHAAASLHVAISNQAMFRKMQSLAAAGYLTVPGGAAMPALTAPASAVWGGLFFTLTVGAFLVWVSLSAGIAWHRMYGGARAFLLLCLLFWAGLFFMVNEAGFAGWNNLHLIVTPPITFALAARHSRTMPPAEDVGSRLAIHLVCLGLLAAIGMGMTDAALFSRIRDRLLLHPAGVAISNFYYRYTLYPAETFKAPAQKQIRGVHLDPSLPAALSRRLGTVLAARDYLPIKYQEAVDLRMSGDTETLHFVQGDRTILRISTHQFFADPQTVLRDYSRSVDRHGGLRQLTFLSLRIVGGLLLYGLLYLPFRWIGGVFFSPVRAAAVAGLLGCGAAALLLVGLQQAPPNRIAPDQVQTALSNGSTEMRVAALRRLLHRGIDIAGFEGYAALATSPNVAERYWLAKALRHSQSQTSWPVHLALLEDPQINVAYNAYASLGFRGDPRGIAEIRRRLPAEPRWYVQFYAYRALRRLGWRPSPVSN